MGADLDGLVDTLARRIASFARRAIAAAKNLIDQVSLPSGDRLLDTLSPEELRDLEGALKKVGKRAAALMEQS